MEVKDIFDDDLFITFQSQSRGPWEATQAALHLGRNTSSLLEIEHGEIPLPRRWRVPRDRQIDAKRPIQRIAGVRCHLKAIAVPGPSSNAGAFSAKVPHILARCSAVHARCR